MKRIPALVFGLALVATSAGCDKLKGKSSGADGSAPSSGGGGGVAGGVLSFLGSDFEGEITMNATTKGGKGPKTLIVGIKKPKVRVDAPNGVPTDNAMIKDGATMLIDPPQKKGWILVPQKKQALLIDFEKMKNAPGASKVFGTTKTKGPGVGASGQPPKIEKTGRKDTVAGYTCEIWNVTETNGRRAELCAAEGITWTDLTDLGMDSPELTLAAVTSEANRFPLRLIAYDQKGTEETRLEATKIDKKALDETRMTVPPDYQVIDLATMLSGAGGLPPGFQPPTKR
jgi:hypothetical protein